MNKPSPATASIPVRASRAHAVCLRADMTVPAAQHNIVAECVRQLLENVAGILAGGDAECVHQARVALRRLRSADIAFSALPPTDDWSELMTEAQWLAGRLGEVRDLQVLKAQTLPPIAQANAAAINFAPLEIELTQRITRAQTNLTKALHTRRARALAQGLQRWLDAEPESARADLTTFARRSLTRRRRAVDTLAARWSKLDAMQRHTLRKRVKKLRYAIEFFAALFPARAVTRYVKHLEQMQKALGNLNDTVAAQALLRPSLRHRQSAPAAGAMLGWLSCGERAQINAAAAVVDRWRRRTPFWH